MKKLCMWLALCSVASSCFGSNAPAVSSQSDEAYQAAMAKEHADDSPTASGAQQQAVGPYETTGEMVGYGDVEGLPLTGYLARPTTGKVRGGVVVIHEWWGLNDQIKSMTDKLASHGYVALAVNMYHGDPAESAEEARELMAASMLRPELGVQNLERAAAYLNTLKVGKIAALGWCYGGMWTLEAGVSLPSTFDALVMYYGRVKTTKEELAALKAPLLGIFAADDGGIPVDQVRAFEAALTASKKDAKIHIYDGVDHAFANPTGDRYSAEAANDAWAKTVEFLEQRLAP